MVLPNNSTYFLRYYTKGIVNVCPQKNLHENVYKSHIHGSQNNWQKYHQ